MHVMSNQGHKTAPVGAGGGGPRLGCVAAPGLSAAAPEALHVGSTVRDAAGGRR